MRILHAIKCGPHKILARGTERFTLQWLTESCCGPVVCHWYGRFIPCGTPSPDEACSIPPGKGVLYVCDQLLCTATSPATPGQPWPTPAPRDIVIRHMGRCWQFVPPFVTADQVPPGADVLDLGQTVECIGQSCADSPCGEPLGYAEALPCDPNYNGPRPLYCPAGLPFECGTLNPSLEGFGNYPACFTFRRSAPTQNYPPNTPVITFPPTASHFNGRTCCQCNCTGGPPLAHAYCPGSTPGGYCCPASNLWAAAPVIGTGTYRIDYDPIPLGYTAGFTVRTELFYTLEGTAGAPIITIAYRITTGTDVQNGFNYDHAPMQPILCPLTILELTPGGAFFPPAPGIYDSCTESRTFNKWQGTWTGRNPTGDPGSFNFLSFTWLVRVINPEPPGCSNDPCRGNLPIMPVVDSGGGTSNGGIRVRGGGSRTPNDALVQQWMQQHYGGCAGCGDSPNPV